MNRTVGGQRRRAGTQTEHRSAVFGCFFVKSRDGQGGPVRSQNPKFLPALRLESETKPSSSSVQEVAECPPKRKTIRQNFSCS
ncbi:hypothetical protein MA16_Dca006546 [Dendrobium catenatum]|uniref:Uncharacterized protein n=1 Tax=Dendrobium catenatum TaxID=906689 RepID=A0A2I0XGU6_9ASPA|nr:hypothetical protein MA16_Dca006546 [Dendrobium catenatum]